MASVACLNRFDGLLAIHLCLVVGFDERCLGSGILLFGGVPFFGCLSGLGFGVERLLRFGIYLRRALGGLEGIGFGLSIISLSA